MKKKTATEPVREIPATEPSEKKTIPELLLDLANRFNTMEDLPKQHQFVIYQTVTFITLRNTVKLMDACFEKIGV